MMLQQDRPDDQIIATGGTHSVKEFVKVVFDCAGFDWKEWVVIDKAFCSTAEVKFKELVKMMVEADMKRLKSVRIGK